MTDWPRFLPSLMASKALAGAALGLCVFLVVLTLLLDANGPARRTLDAYTGYLDKKLKNLMLRPIGQKIAIAQILGLLLLGGATLLVRVPYAEILALLGTAGPVFHLERQRRKRVAEIERQLDNFMLALASALKSIPSVNAAFQSVAETAQGPIREEIELCNREMRVGSTLEEALAHMAERVGSSRLDSALSAVVIGRQLGGNLTRVLENTAGSVREMSRLEGVLRTKTSEAKMQLWVIGLAPFALVVCLSVMSPGYFEPLQASSRGYTVGAAAIGSWLLALFLARKVLSVSM
jgi:tight adherence protein B